MKLLLYAVFAIAISAQTLAHATDCLHYLGDPVRLTGKVVLRTFYGPSGYDENPRTDVREHQAVLLLAKPVCVAENKSDYDAAEFDQKEVTLVPIKGEDLRQYQDKVINVSGTLFHANTGLITRPSLSPLKASPAIMSDRPSTVPKPDGYTAAWFARSVREDNP